MYPERLKRAAAKELREMRRTLSVEVGHSFSGGVSSSHGLVLYGDVLSGQGTATANGILAPVNGDRHIRALVGILE